MNKKSKKLKTPKSIEDFALRDLGAILRRERERRRLTMLQVAERAKKSKAAIHFYETGQRPINFSTLINLCSAIRVSPDYIIHRWMESETFDVLDEERRKEYHSVIEEMIKYGFSNELDNLLVYFRGLINQEKETRERIRQKERIQKEYFAMKELREGGKQDDDGI